MTKLMIINSNLSSFELLQAAAEVGEKYSDNVIIIPPLLSRITYALEPIAALRNPLNFELIMVVTLTTPFIDFVILRRHPNFELNIIEHKMYKRPVDIMKLFPQFYDEFRPHATVILIHDLVELNTLADRIQYTYNPSSCYIRSFKRWDFMLMDGSICRGDEDGFDKRYHIPNFTQGIQSSIREKRRCITKIIIKEGTSVPCQIYGFSGEVQPIKVINFILFFFF